MTVHPVLVPSEPAAVAVSAAAARHASTPRIGVANGATRVPLAASLPVTLTKNSGDAVAAGSDTGSAGISGGRWTARPDRR